MKKYSNIHPHFEVTLCCKCREALVQMRIRPKVNRIFKKILNIFLFLECAFFPSPAVWVTMQSFKVFMTFYLEEVKKKNNFFFLFVKSVLLFTTLVWAVFITRFQREQIEHLLTWFHWIFDYNKYFLILMLTHISLIIKP